MCFKLMKWNDYVTVTRSQWTSVTYHLFLWGRTKETTYYCNSVPGIKGFGACTGLDSTKLLKITLNSTTFSISLPPFPWTTASVWTSFSYERKCCISFVNRGHSWLSDSKEAQNSCCVSSSVKFSHCQWQCRLPCDCWCRSIKSPRVQSFSSSCSAHTIKDTNSWFNGQGVTVPNWPANLLDLTLVNKSTIWDVKRKMRDVN